MTATNLQGHKVLVIQHGKWRYEGLCTSDEPDFLWLDDRFTRKPMMFRKDTITHLEVQE